MQTLQRSFSVDHPEFSRRKDWPLGHVQEKDGRTQIQKKNDFFKNQETTSSVNTNKFQYPFMFYEKNYK